MTAALEIHELCTEASARCMSRATSTSRSSAARATR